MSDTDSIAADEQPCPPVKCEVLFGHTEIRQFYISEEGGMACYSYRIDYDQDGIEVGRTKPEAISFLRRGE